MRNSLRVQSVFAVLGLAGVGIVLFSTSLYGVGLSPDSVQYISTARSLLAGDGYFAFDGNPIVSWPPLYPTLLAGLGLADIDPLDGARYFNAAVFGLTVFATGHLLRRHLESWALVILGTTSILISVVLLRVSIQAWSESLFVLLAILFVICLSRFLTEQRFVFLLLIAVLAGLACVQRYMGITLVLTGIVSIALLMRTKSLQDRFWYLTFFGLVSLIPVLFWIGRNYWLTSSLTGSRPLYQLSFLGNIGNAFATLASWLLPTNYVTMTPARVFLVIMALAVLAALVALGLRSRLSRPVLLPAVRLAPAGIFVTVYTLSLLAAATLVGWDPMDDRLLAPIYVFVLLFVLLGVEQAMNGTPQAAQRKWNSQRLWLVLGLLLVFAGLMFNEWTVGKLVSFGEIKGQLLGVNLLSVNGSIQTPFRVMILILGIASVLFGLLVIALRKKPWIGRLVIVGILGIWLTYPIAQTSFYVSTKVKDGAGGFNSARWRGSPLIDHLMNNPLDGTVYTNVPHVIYILTQTSGTSSARGLPFEANSTSISTTSMAVLRAAMASDVGDTYLVWFDDERLGSNQAFRDVSSKFEFEEIKKSPDGGIYLLK